MDNNKLKKIDMGKYAIPILILGLFLAPTASMFVRYSTAPSIVLAAYRKTIVTVMILPFVLWKCREEMKQLKMSQWIWCGISGAFLGIHFFSFFEGVNYSSIAASQVLTSCEVVFVALAMWAMKKERMNLQRGLSILIALGGAVVIALSKNSGGAVDAPYGNAMSLVAAIAMAIYSLIGAEQRKNMTTTLYTFLVYGSAAIVLDILVPISGNTLFGHDKINFLCALGMAVFSSLLGHSIYNWAVKYLSPTFISISRLSNPILATIWGVILLKEVPGIGQVVGGIVVIFGILLYHTSKAKMKKE